MGFGVGELVRHLLIMQSRALLEITAPMDYLSDF